MAKHVKKENMESIEEQDTIHIVYGYFTKYIKLIESMLSLVGASGINKYLDMAIEPIDKIKNLDNLGKILIYLLIFNSIFQMLPTLITTVANILITVPFSLLEMMLISDTNYILIASIILILASPIISLISIGIIGIVEYYVALFFRGKSGLNDHLKITFGTYFLINLVSIPWLILYIIIQAISIIPINAIMCLTTIPAIMVSIIQMILGIYGLYVKYIMLREWHKIGNIEAIVTIVVPLIVYIAILSLITLGIILGLGYLML